MGERQVSVNCMMMDTWLFRIWSKSKTVLLWNVFVSLRKCVFSFGISHNNIFALFCKIYRTIFDFWMIFIFEFECGRKFIECRSNVKIVIRQSGRVPGGCNMLVLLEVIPEAKISTTAFD